MTEGKDSLGLNDGQEKFMVFSCFQGGGGPVGQLENFGVRPPKTDQAGCMRPLIQKL
ncbi:hypothetical protein PGTUg99_003603 [Puccinia graminis f. sp. tritici]|uniref:Uncharacterized protein n=1 Tax=Puccinia graminis f. sp. tritici TaxID=56615 RepID=A0A5B0PP75_PUCGR|nr:hypothetical protein PGTUg99_003603 [Puccinia graminis f. sp. tritici]